MGFGRTDDGVTWEALPSPLMDPPLDSETGAVEFFRFVAFSLVDEQLCSRAAKQSITQGALRIMPTVERVVNYALAETFTYSHISQKHIHASTQIHAFPSTTLESDKCALTFKVHIESSFGERTQFDH